MTSSLGKNEFCFPRISMFSRDEVEGNIEITDTSTKTRPENKPLRNGDYFVIIASSTNPLLLTEHAANGLKEKRR